MGIAGLLLLYAIAILVVGAGAPKLNGYGTWTDFFIGVGILAASVLLFFFRRIVEDKEKVHWKEETPTMPEGPDRDALIEVGWNARRRARRSPGGQLASVPFGGERWATRR